MEITYKFADSETVTIEVSEEWANILLDLDRQEYNANRRETRRHCSLEAYNVEDNVIASDEDVLRDVIDSLEKERLYAAIARLSPRHRYLIEQVYFNRRSYTDIAREEGIHRTAVSKATERALANLRKCLI